MLIKLREDVNSFSKIDYIDEYVNNRTIDSIVGCSSQNVYEDYLEFLTEHNYQVKISKMQFARRLTFKYDLTSKVIKYDGKCIRVIVKI